MISLSISAFLLRLPTRLKLDSILQVSLSRWHLSHGIYTGAVMTLQRSYTRRSVPAREDKLHCLTFCCRHSLQALFTPGCLLLALLTSYPSSGLSGELSPSFVRLRFPLVLVGLVKGDALEALPTLPALLWVRPSDALGSTFIEVKARATQSTNSPPKSGECQTLGSRCGANGASVIHLSAGSIVRSKVESSSYNILQSLIVQSRVGRYTMSSNDTKGGWKWINGYLSPPRQSHVSPPSYSQPASPSSLTLTKRGRASFHALNSKISHLAAIDHLSDALH